MIEGYVLYLTAHKVNAQRVSRQRKEKMSLRFKLRSMFPYGRATGNTRWEVSPQITINEMLIAPKLFDAAFNWATGEWNTTREKLEKQLLETLAGD